ncbi:hypothetical protein O3M35_002824 [Rhynocoris fuscipes]|uniref:Uncharacterized protein n=1 Tax=Rhynocoris fuscipes TaxID=488301 RepID=A0AAW1CN69_9HEMI
MDEKSPRLRIQGGKKSGYKPTVDKRNDMKLMPVDLTQVPPRVQQLLNEPRNNTFPRKSIKKENKLEDSGQIQNNSSLFNRKIYDLPERKGRSRSYQRKVNDMNVMNKTVPPTEQPSQTKANEKYAMKQLRDEAVRKIGWKKDVIKIEALNEEPKRYIKKDRNVEQSLEAIRNKLAERLWDRNGLIKNGLMQKTKEDLKSVYNLCGRNSPNAWDLDENNRRHFAYR